MNEKTILLGQMETEVFHFAILVLHATISVWATLIPNSVVAYQHIQHPFSASSIEDYNPTVLIKS